MPSPESSAVRRAASAAALLVSVSCAVEYYSKRVEHICPRCFESGGEGHLCEKTAHCSDCGIDLASRKTHICHLTRYCRKCDRDVGLYHACGTTSFCETCKQEKGPDHICGKTRFSKGLGKEVPLARAKR